LGWAGRQVLVRDLDMPALGADLAYQIVNRAVEQGLGNLDVGAIVLPLEEEAGRRLEVFKNLDLGGWYRIVI